MRKVQKPFAQSNAAKIPLPFKGFLRIFFQANTSHEISCKPRSASIAMNRTLSYPFFLSLRTPAVHFWV